MISMRVQSGAMNARLIAWRSHASAHVEQALDQTLKDLRLDYLDLYLMHWPVAQDDGTPVEDYLDVSHTAQLCIIVKLRQDPP